MAKNIAILIRGNQEEGLRMSVGAIMMDDSIDVYIIDKKVESNDKNDLNIESINDFELGLFTNCKDNADIQFVSTEDMAPKLPEYDLVIPY
ncbi:MAG: hypothetical protein GY816_00240 [Cytophagales bacterium]|nr:hypothetical protein [Cytophagales bacterium]